MKKEFLSIIDYLVNHGELMKAYSYLRNPPAFIEDDLDVAHYLSDIKNRISELKEMQDYGTLQGHFNAQFTDPQDVTKLIAFQKLRKLLKGKNCKYVVDVGCYTGWMGRQLSKDGIAVHGIDIHPVIIQIAAFYATGTVAKFEYLPVQKLGAAHPKQFDGAIAFDVLEHTFDPVLAIENINLATKRWVFINLPHPQGEEDAKKYPLRYHEHTHAFSESTVKKLFPKANIEIIKNEGGTINWFIYYDVQEL